MPKQEVSVLVTDLDDTLYSWFSVWFRSFSALLDRLVQDSRIPRDRLIEEIRAVHRTHGTSEYAFLIEELPTLQSKHPGQNLIEVYSEAIRAHREARDKALVPFPGVLTTLKRLRAHGVLIVAYTETMGLYTNFRLKRLGLDALIDFVYLPEDHEVPAGMTQEQLQKYTAQYEHLAHARNRHTPQGELKPNPRLLLDILADVGGVPERTVYIGDKPFKDVAMAKQAGVTSLLAVYGDLVGSDDYRLLQDVSHWTDEDVSREIQERKIVQELGLGKADYNLEHSYAEILDLFAFIPHKRREE